jgi:hypothetical protein
MTTSMPLARYGTINGALASGFKTAELHHLTGHEPGKYRRVYPKPARRALTQPSCDHVLSAFRQASHHPAGDENLVKANCPKPGSVAAAVLEKRPSTNARPV